VIDAERAYPPGTFCECLSQGRFERFHHQSEREEVAASMFKGLDEAAHALLLSTCKVLNDTGVQYAIAGGWVPVLRRGELIYNILGHGMWTFCLMTPSEISKGL